MSEIFGKGVGVGGGGFGDQRPDLNVVDDESEDEGREDEIKELLAGALCNDTFDDDSDTSFLTNNNSFHHNNSNGNGNGATVIRKGSNGNGHGRSGMDMDMGLGSPEHSIHSTNSHSGSSVHHNLPATTHNALDTNGNPPTQHQQSSFPFLNTFQNQLTRRPLPFGINTTGNLPVNGNTTSTTGNLNDKGRGTGEIELTNKSVSLAHTQHCPKDGHEFPATATPQPQDTQMYDQMFAGTSSSMDQLKTLCEFRERQLLRVEETVQSLSKDKRALNHQIGLMKAEMVQMRGVQEEYENELKLKDEEIHAQKSNIQELMAEYQKLKVMYSQARDDNSRLGIEVGKLNQQSQLRDSVGTTTQLAEVNDAVRQVHEKHAKELNLWNKKVQDLESQLRVLSKTQTKVTFAESPPRIMNNIEKVNSQAQTIEPQLYSCASQTDEQEQVYQIMSLEEQEEVRAWREDKEYLINMYEREIEKWKEEVEALPAQLFAVWEKNQLSRKPATSETGTTTMTTTILTSNAAVNCELIQQPKEIPLCIDTQTQTVSSARTNLNSSFSRSIEDLHRMRQVLDDPGLAAAHGPGTAPSTSSPPIASFVVNNPSHPTRCTVQVQTDQTLETYKVLNELIEQWIIEVEESTQRASFAEEKLETTQQSLEITLEKMAILTQKYRNCRSKSQKFKEIAECLHKEIRTKTQELFERKQDTASKYISFLSSIHSTLDEINLPL